MTDREKLIEVLMKQVGYTLPVFTATQTIELLADCLIANGVTFAKDTDVPSKWISVEDRLPTEEDADDDMCVLAIHKATPRRYFHWRSVADSPFDFTHWRPMPEPPADGEG